MKVAIGLIAAATILAGCTASSTSPEQAMAPAAGPGSPRTYDVQTMTQFDDAADDANDYCCTYENEPARYVGRTLEQVTFECAPR